jgi:hypothetical protein
MVKWAADEEPVDPESHPVIYDGLAEDESEAFQVMGVVWMDEHQGLVDDIEYVDEDIYRGER